MEFPPFFDVSCCGILTLSGAFPMGICTTEWNLDIILHVIWKLLNDSPARRDIYITLSQWNDFRLSFSKTSRVEDEKVSAKGILI